MIYAYEKLWARSRGWSCSTAESPIIHSSAACCVTLAVVTPSSIAPDRHSMWSARQAPSIPSWGGRCYRPDTLRRSLFATKETASSCGCCYPRIMEVVHIEEAHLVVAFFEIEQPLPRKAICHLGDSSPLTRWMTLTALYSMRYSVHDS